MLTSSVQSCKTSNGVKGIKGICEVINTLYSLDRFVTSFEVRGSKRLEGVSNSSQQCGIEGLTFPNTVKQLSLSDVIPDISQQ